MEVIICHDADQVGVIGAAKVAQIARQVGLDVVLGVATGSSPLAMYQHLGELVERGVLNLSRASAFALDEYVGLAVDHPESYHATIDRTVTQPLHLDPARVHVPDGSAEGLEMAGPRYDQAIATAGGVDVQILGIGANGHIGFNEPSSSLSSRTRVTTLSARTRADNARFFGSEDQVPWHCITQGIGTIMEARNLVLVATGEHKADAIAACVEGPITSMCPASVLQMHQQATVIIDDAAAGKLKMADYYKLVHELLPDWQKLDIE